eukprot:3688143-Prymnesium_polylepis.1
MAENPRRPRETSLTPLAQRPAPWGWGLGRPDHRAHRTRQGWRPILDCGALNCAPAPRGLST